MRRDFYNLAHDKYEQYLNKSGHLIYTENSKLHTLQQIIDGRKLLDHIAQAFVYYEWYNRDTDDYFEFEEQVIFIYNTLIQLFYFSNNDECYLQMKGVEFGLRFEEQEGEVGS